MSNLPSTSMADTKILSPEELAAALSVVDSAAVDDTRPATDPRDDARKA